MTPDSMRMSRVVALALIVGTFLTAQAVLVDLAAGKSINLVRNVTVALLFWVVWAFLTPVVLMAVRRWPLDTKPPFRPVLVHAVVSTILAAVQTVVTLGLRSITLYLSGAVRAQDVLAQIGSLTALVWGVFTGVLFYGILIAVYTALRFRGLYAAERVSAAALEAELTRSQLDALRSQVRPHFIFNALNAVSVLVGQDADKAQRMLLRLSSLLRRSLDEEAHEVALRQELAFLNDYLDIQRVRFGDRLSVQLDVADEVLDARFPVFLLQPLVENAIEHGESEDGRTMIVLSAGREGDMLHVTLEDEGPGIRDSAPVREGVGLRNTRTRLHHLYGRLRASVELRAAHEGRGSPGARVDIWIPFSPAPI